MAVFGGKSDRCVQPEFWSSFSQSRWFESTVAWMRSQLLAHGGDMISIYHADEMHISCNCIENRNNNGNGGLKCNPCFVNDALITERLAMLAPNFVAKPITIDTNRRLLRCGTMVRYYLSAIWIGPKMNNGRIVFPEIHQTAVGKKQALLDAGLRRIKFYISEKELQRATNYIEGMNLWEREFSEEIRRNIQEVEGLGIPATFVYTDLHVTNFYCQPGSQVSLGAIDFAEAVMSHAFLETTSSAVPLSTKRTGCSVYEKLSQHCTKCASTECFSRIPAIGVKHILVTMWLFKEMVAIRCSVSPDMLEDFTRLFKWVL